MKVPKGKKIYSGRHCFKEGVELPPYLAGALEKPDKKSISPKPEAYKTSVDMK